MGQDGICSKCHTSKGPFVAPRTCKRCSDKSKGAHGESPGWREANRERLQGYNKSWRAEAKLIVLKHYGGKCECCQENDIRFLTIDHKEGNGTQHRKELGVKAGPPFYNWLIKHKFPPQFTVLCCNCNWGRFLNGGVCPHKEERHTVVDASEAEALRFMGL